MKRVISLLFIFLLTAVCLYARNVNLLMNDGSVIKGELIGKTADSVYVKDTNDQTITVQKADIKSAFDQDTGDEIDLTAVNTETAPQDNSSANDVVTNAIEPEPQLVVIPGTYVYYYPYGGADCFYYGGYWWRPWHGFWYRSTVYNGGWAVISPRYVPTYVSHLPGNWRGRIAAAPRIGWGEARSNWREWQRTGYWANHGWKREGVVRPGNGNGEVRRQPAENREKPREGKGEKKEERN